MRLAQLAAVLVFLTSLPAHADTFVLLGGSTTLIFNAPSSPTPTNTSSDYAGFSVDPLSVTTNGATSQQAVSFYSGAQAGGLSIEGAGQGSYYDAGSGLLMDQSGATVFSGTLAHPTFTPGTYNLSSLGGSNPAYAQNFTLLIIPPTLNDIFVLSSASTNLVFEVPPSPTPANTSSDYAGFSVDPLSVTTNGVASQQAVSFYSGTQAGGLSIEGAEQGSYYDAGSGLLVDQSGATVFSGTLAHPTFIPGTYNLSNLGGSNPAYAQDFNLTILGPTATTPVATTPEPGGLALLTTGGLMLAGLARRRLLWC